MSSTPPVTLPPRQPAPASGDLRDWSRFELVTKNATLLVVSCYAIGYLIVVLNDNPHGFLETSLLKPRAITAGAMFILLMALPISVTQGSFFASGSERESGREMIARWLLGITDFSASCFAATLLMLLVFVDDLTGTPQSRQA